MIFINTLGVTRRLYSFRLDVESKTGKEIPESSRKDFCQSTRLKFCLKCCLPIRQREDHVETNISIHQK